MCSTACAKSRAISGRGSAKARTFISAATRSRMAKDVERALVDIVAQFGARTTDEAVLFVGELKKKGRFQLDVY